MLIAEKEIGIKEVPGKGDNKRIVEYHSYTRLGAPHDEISWCSSFCCFVMESVLIESPKNALARSWLEWGISCEPRYGSVLIFAVGRYEWQGHVGFYVYQDKEKFYVLGGNQRNEVNVTGYKKELLLDARWPSREEYLQITRMDA